MIAVLLVISLVVFAVIPKLILTSSMLEDSIEEMLPRFEEWIREHFAWNQMVLRCLEQGVLKQENLISSVELLLGNGIGEYEKRNVLSSAFQIVREIGRTTQ